MGRHKPDILSVIRDGIDVSIPEIMQDAAAEIERLRAENARLWEKCEGLAQSVLDAREALKRKGETDVTERLLIAGKYLGKCLAGYRDDDLRSAARSAVDLAKLIFDAVDEIERLKADCDRWDQDYDELNAGYVGQVTKMKEEIEALKASKTIVLHQSDLVGPMQYQIEKLKAENEGLRDKSGAAEIERLKAQIEHSTVLTAYNDQKMLEAEIERLRVLLKEAKVVNAELRTMLKEADKGADDGIRSYERSSVSGG